MRSKKIVLVGDGAVGNRSLKAKYSSNASPVGEDRYLLNNAFILNASVNALVNGIPYNLGIWTPNCNEDYDRRRPSNYTQTDVVILTYSVVNHASFENIRTKWLPEIRQHLPNVAIVLAATKTDLRNDPATLQRLQEKGLSPITTQQGQALATEIGASRFFEVSALYSQNVTELFHFAAIADETPTPAPRKAQVQPGFLSSIFSIRSKTPVITTTVPATTAPNNPPITTGVTTATTGTTMLTTTTTTTTSTEPTPTHVTLFHENVQKQMTKIEKTGELSDEPPKEFTCPISQDIMTDPVLVKASGKFYDRDHITGWIQAKGVNATDPETRQPITLADIVPQPEIKAKIDEWTRRHQFYQPMKQLIKSTEALSRQVKMLNIPVSGLTSLTQAIKIHASNNNLAGVQETMESLRSKLADLGNHAATHSISTELNTVYGHFNQFITSLNLDVKPLEEISTIVEKEKESDDDYGVARLTL